MSKINSPFNFSVTAAEGERFRRRVWYSVAALLLTLAFTAGFITVYVNTYNIIHDEPMEIFQIDDNENGIEITVFNHYFAVPKNSKEVTQ